MVVVHYSTVQCGTGDVVLGQCRPRLSVPLLCQWATGGVGLTRKKEEGVGEGEDGCLAAFRFRAGVAFLVIVAELDTPAGSRDTGFELNSRQDPHEKMKKEYENVVGWAVETKG